MQTEEPDNKNMAVRLFTAMLLVVFVAELCTHAIVNFFRIKPALESTVDAALVIILAFPVLYIFIFRPLSREIVRCRRTEKVKDDFISMVSHELRTPLSITKEGINLILDQIPGPINEQQTKILTISRNNMNRLARIINSLLDISRIEAGRIGLRRVEFDIASVILKTTAEFAPKIRQKGLELRTNILQSSILFTGDIDAFTHIMTNLIENSLKFTEKGSITITAQDKGYGIEVSVADTGIGIASEDVPNIFKKFQQFNRVNGPGEKGTGLGLAIAKGMVDAHGGKIQAASEAGKGTTITFILPKTS